MSRYPPYIRKKLLTTPGKRGKVEYLLDKNRLNTVCESARCPNRFECFHRGVATFMILGNTCTRHCRFCSVKKGVPEPVDPGEPERVARVADELNLRHVVITSVTRDDLPDYGAGHFAATIRAIHEANPAMTVEVLVPDFKGSIDAIRTVLAQKPDVFNHNVETVPRLYPYVRPGANYERSVSLLKDAGNLGSDHPLLKSGLMLGLGEHENEVLSVMKDLRNAGCDILTIGQYLSPGKEQLPVVEYIIPEQFDVYYTLAMEMGFGYVLSGTFVRSSYKSDEVFSNLPKK